MTNTSKYPPYPDYRDSGVDWLGEIPGHWNSLRVKLLVGNDSSVVQTGPFGAQLHASDYLDEGVPLILIKNVRDLFIDTTDIPKVSIEDAERLSLYRLKIGDIVFSRVGSIGRIALVTDREEGWLISGQMLRLRIDNPQLDSRFAVYIFSSEPITKYAEFESVGSTRDSINTEILRNTPLPLPPLPEQRAIAEFLDRETARLDTLIDAKRRLIELLKEKRAALISHVVTKGLDPNVPMKESGIEWLGEIPAHWSLTQLRYIAESLQTGPFGSQLHSDEYVSCGIPVINPSHMENGSITPDWDVTVDQGTWDRLSRHAFQLGDIVFARRGDLGRCALVYEAQVGWLCGTGSLRVRLMSDVVNPAYLNELLSTQFVSEWLLLQSVGSTMDNLNTSILGRLPIPLPPIDEQESIIQSLASGTTSLAQLVTKTEETVASLAEYRTALIAAAVTGKIDVREHARG